MCDKSDPTQTCCSIFWGPPVQKKKSSPARSKPCIGVLPPDGLFIQDCNGKNNDGNFFTSPMCNTDLVRCGASTMDLCSRQQEYTCYYTMDC